MTLGEVSLSQKSAFSLLRNSTLQMEMQCGLRLLGTCSAQDNSG